MEAALKKAWQLTKLTSASIIPDLLCFTMWEAIGLAIFAASSIVFSFIDFNYLTDPANNPSIYSTVNDRLAGLERWRRILMCFSGGAAFTGVLCVVLTTKGKLSAFFWGAINSLLYGLFAYAYGYAGDAQLNLFFFLPVQFWGLWCWGENLLENAEQTVQSRQLSPWQWLICLLLAGGITVGFYYEIPVFAVSLSGVYYFEGQDIPRSLDSIVNALSMIAQMLSIYRYSEQWYFWLTVDILQIIMFTGVAGYGIVINVVVMWCLFTLNALSGLYAWQMRYWYPHGEPSATEENDDVEQNKHSVKDSTGSVLYQKLPGSDSPAGAASSTCNSILNIAGNSINCVSEDVNDAHCTFSTDSFAHGNSLKGFTPPTQFFSKNTSPGKKLTKGLVVGKFWPFHRGHQHLIETGIAQCDELYVIVCHRPYHHPSGYISQQAIRETCPTVYTMVIRDVYDPQDSILWAKLVATWCGFIPHKVFTSETYGEPFARALTALGDKGHVCEHVLCDFERQGIPISGTAIRSNPYLPQHWTHVPLAMRNFYCRRLVLVGAESTGKTTLSQHLANYFKSPWVAEYGREFCEELVFKRQKENPASSNDQEVKEQSVTAASEEDPEEFSFSDADFFTIMDEQCKREILAARASTNGLIVCDTNAWATLRWFERYQHHAPPVELLQLQQHHRAGIAHFTSSEKETSTAAAYRDFTETVLYILCDVEGSTFVQDGLRDGRHVRDQMHADFVQQLQAEQLPYITIKGSFEERFDRTIAALEERHFLLPTTVTEAVSGN
jgi:NadR type nicotinamide-nucleotide adenylyltransferase